VSHEYAEPREGTITLWYKRPDKLRKEVSYPERRHVEVFDGTRAWFDTGSGPQIRGPVVTAAIRDGMQELDLPANYLDADLTYFNISQEIPGKLAHVVKVRKNGYTKELMFDVNTYLLEVTGEYENPWGATDKMTKFDRYRPVDGILIPHRVEYWRANRMVSETEITEVVFNGPVDDSLFTLPQRSEGTTQP
jgi:outer membrane lipoprotein-sorting protein